MLLPMQSRLLRSVASVEKLESKPRRLSLKAFVPACVLREGARPLQRSRETGSWILTATPDQRANGTDRLAEEFRDGVRLRFGLLPSFLPHPYHG
jgi:hypothetical protein